MKRFFRIAINKHTTNHISQALRYGGLWCDSEGMRGPAASCHLVFLFVLRSDRSANEALCQAGSVLEIEQVSHCLAE